MHLVGPYLTTTSYKKRKEKITKSKQEELERDWRDRNQRLKQMGLPKETFEQFLEWVHGRGKKVARQTNNRTEVSKTYAKACKEGQGRGPASSTTNKQSIVNNNKNDNNHTHSEVEGEVASPKSLGLWITGPCSSKPSPVYTGTKVKGIGTMHKSNAVPIFSDEEAIEISRMRR